METSYLKKKKTDAQEFCKIMEERSRELDLELGYKVGRWGEGKRQKTHTR